MKITKFYWTEIVDPWNYSDIHYEIDGYVKHRMHLPHRRRRVDMTTPEMVVWALDAELECIPEDRSEWYSDRIRS